VTSGAFSSRWRTGYDPGEYPRPDFSPADGSIAIIEAPRVFRASAENGPLSALIDPAREISPDYPLSVR